MKRLSVTTESAFLDARKRFLRVSKIPPLMLPLALGMCAYPEAEQTYIESRTPVERDWLAQCQIGWSLAHDTSFAPYNMESLALGALTEILVFPLDEVEAASVYRFARLMESCVIDTQFCTLVREYEFGARTVTKLLNRATKLIVSTLPRYINN